MKAFLLLGIAVLLMFSCTPGNNPTPTPSPTPSPTPTPTTSTTFQDMQGLWYPSHTGFGSIVGIRNANNYIVKLTDTLTNNPSFPVGSYKMYGGFFGPYNYPSAYYYFYNSERALGGNPPAGASSHLPYLPFLYKVTTDSLIISKLNVFSPDYYPLYGQEVKYYTRTPHVFGSTATVNWKVDLTSPYTRNGDVSIYIRINGGSPIWIPIIDTQTNYSGSISVSLLNTNPNIAIKLINNVYNLSPAPNPLPPSQLIEFSTELTYGGIKAYSNNKTYCVSYGTSPFDCQGYPLLDATNMTTSQGYESKIEWFWN